MILEIGPQKVRNRRAGKSKGTRSLHLTLLPEQISNKASVLMTGNPTHAYFKQRGKKTAEWRQKCIIQWVLGFNSSDNCQMAVLPKRVELAKLLNDLLRHNILRTPRCHLQVPGIV